MQLLAVSLVAVFVVLHALDSMFRWLFVQAGAGAAIYVRDYLLVAAIGLTFIGQRGIRRDIRNSFWMLWAFGLLVCAAFLSELSAPQVLFGIKVWLPFIAGFLLVDSGLIGLLHRPRWWAALWALLCIGVFINYFYRFPWIGLTVQVGDLAVSGNREWNAYGIPRLSGFSRSSFDCAMAVLILYGYLFVTAKGPIRTAFVVLVSAAAIALTTAKGAAGAFLIAVAVGPVLSLVRQAGSLWYLPCLAVLTVMALLGAVAPLVSFQIPFPRLVEGSPEYWLFSSMLSRAWETWPQALALLSDWQLLLGRGLGGIGAAQYVFEAGRENPADNLFVYLYVTAGLLGVAGFVYLPWASRRLQAHTTAGRITFYTLLAVYSYGITANVIENAIFALALGVVSAWMVRGQSVQGLQSVGGIDEQAVRAKDPAEIAAGAWLERPN